MQETSKALRKKASKGRCREVVRYIAAGEQGNFSTLSAHQVVSFYGAEASIEVRVGCLKER